MELEDKPRFRHLLKSSHFSTTHFTVSGPLAFAEEVEQEAGK